MLRIAIDKSILLSLFFAAVWDVKESKGIAVNPSQWQLQLTRT